MAKFDPHISKSGRQGRGRVQERRGEDREKG